MNLAAIDWLRISINLLEVIFVIGCLLMILLILMQRPKQEGLGAAFGAGVTDQVFGARTTNVLQRGTVYLASMFFVLALALAVLIGHKNQQTSMLATKKAHTQVEATQPAEPKKEPAPPQSLIKELPAEDTPPATTPAKDATPAAPAAPKDAVPALSPAPAPPAVKTPAPAAPLDHTGSPKEKSGQP